MLRVGMPDYAHSSFRESFHNALIHRDYSRLGTVHIQWYEHYIEISNPGDFVEGVRLDREGYSSVPISVGRQTVAADLRSDISEPVTADTAGQRRLDTLNERILR